MIVGIDLGTTNSLVGFWRNGSITLVPNALGHLLTPSAVGLSDGGDILVGLPARERLTTHPTLTAAAFKRYMGTERLMFLPIAAPAKGTYRRRSTTTTRTSS